MANNAAAGDNYNLIYRSDETVDFRRKTSPTIIDGGATTYADSTWHNAVVTRIPGLFEVFMNDASIGSVADATYTVSNYFVFDLDANDEIFFADPYGRHAIRKSQLA